MKLPKSTGYTPIPEGYTIFQITNVEYDEDFDKMTVEEVTANGQKNIERFMFTKNNGSRKAKSGLSNRGEARKTCLEDLLK